MAVTGSSPFGQAAAPSLTWGAASPFGGGGGGASPFGCKPGAAIAGLPPLPQKPHKEVDLEPEVRAAFEALAFERYKIPEVEPPPSVC